MTNEEAIEYNKNLREYMRITDKKSEYKFLNENYEALDMAIKALEQQEKSESEHDHEVVKAYNDGQAYILDKIRAQVEKMQKIAEKHQSVIDNIEILETHGVKESNVRVHNPQRERYMKFDGKLSAYDEVLEIIDKYRGDIDVFDK